VTISIVSDSLESSREGLRAGPGALRHELWHGTLVAIAVAVPVFAFLAFIIAQTALTFIAERAINGAVAATVLQVQTDPDRAAQFTPAQIRGGFCGHLPVFMDCSDMRLHLDIHSYGAIAAIDSGRLRKESETESAEAHYDFGGPEDIVVIRANYRWSTPSIYRQLFSHQPSTPVSHVSAFAFFRKEG